MISICKKYGALFLFVLSLFFFITANAFAADLTVSVDTSKGALVGGANVYAFTESGVYTGINTPTDSNGIALFDSTSFAAGNYKFRADYLGSQFWTDVITIPDTLYASLTIQEETVTVTVTTFAGPAPSVPVYLFSGPGAYLGQNKATDTNGQVSFDLPVGRDYKFRANTFGNQYWSAVITIQAGTNDVSIDAGGGTLQVTVEKSAGNPLEGINTYLYNASGTYMGVTNKTDSSGIVTYSVPEGDYKVRADYMGYQYWSADINVTANTNTSITVPHQDVNITVQAAFQGSFDPIAGANVYLFTSSGTYMGQLLSTDSNGQVTFNLAENSYKVRADYMGQQFWSTDFIWQNTTVDIPMADAEVTVTGMGLPLENVNVYMFTGAGTYLGVNHATDINGNATFRTPAGPHKFRADYQGSQFWSNTETLTADQNNPVAISTGGGLFTLSVTKGAAHLAGVNCYLFTESGTYLGVTKTTDSNGDVSFAVADGSYKIRADYLGNQFWSDIYTIPTTLSGTLDIPHQDIVITVQSSFQSTPTPIEGVNVYLFTSSGAYMGQYLATDSSGQVTFNLPQESYKVRADYMSQQFWSVDFTWQNSIVDMPMADAEVTVTGTGQPLENVNIYLFTGAGTYLGVTHATDVNGNATFRTPAGLHKFRADYQGSQFWSNVETLIADQVNPVAISTGGGVFGFTVTKGGTALTGVNCYLFTESGTYLGVTKISDSNGAVSFSVADGSYKIRVDYLGNQFWSDVYTVPATLSGSLDIPHQDLVITVQDSYQGTQNYLEGVNVYLFTSSGAYMGQVLATGSSGQVTFNLPEKTYKVRADYMGQQFWSDDFTWQNSTITIPKGAVDIHVQRGGDDVPGARVYLFTAASAYLGINDTADASGMVSFLIPSGTYLFRADDSGEQKWSSPVTIISDQTVNIEINFSDGPSITASADPATILQGGASVLTWETTNAETVTIEPGTLSVDLSGSMELSPTATTDYIITAQGQGGTVNETVTINVIDTPLDVDYGIGDDEQQGGGGLVGETVRIFNGNVIDYRSDLAFASPNSLGLSLGAVYNSRSSNAGSMGFGWAHTYEITLDPAFEIDGMSFLKITDNTGKAHYFTEEQAGEFKGVYGEKSKVVLESGVYIWTQLDGSKYGFSSTGQLTWMDDPSGNRLSLAYSGTLLDTVTGISSGRVLTFSYNADNLIDHVTGPVTGAVTDGIWVEYGYDADDNLISVLYADNSGFDYLYTDTNDIHNLTEKKNKAGHLINTWGYDTTDRAIYNFNRDGKGVDIVYETDTQIEVTDAYGKTREYLLTESSGRKRVASITDGPGGAGGFPYSDSNAVSWIYDENINPTEIESAGGTITQYLDHDERGNPGTVIFASGEPEERTISYTWHPDISTPLTKTEASVLQPGGLKETIWDYDVDYNSEPNENPTTNVSRIIEKGFTRDNSGSVTAFEYITTISYNSKRQVVSIDGPAPGTADTTIMTYDPTTGDVLSVTRPLIGATTYSSYDNAGQAGVETDINGQSTSYTYDARGRVTDVTNNADSSVSSILYNIAGLPETRTDEDGVDTTFEYESIYGRLFKRFDYEGNYIQYVYDSQGNTTEQGYFDPESVRTNRKRYVYQDATHNMPGMLFREISGDDTYTQYGYDLEGNVASVRNPNGNITYYAYDSLNRVKTVTQPGSVATEYDYDAQGNLTSVTDAESHITIYQYDDMGRLVSTTSPDTGTVTYVYDENGNPVSKTDTKGISVDYTYDILDRLTHVHFPDSSQDFTYSYDQGINGIGRRTGMTDESGSTTFSYDNRGRLTGKSSTVLGVTYDLSRVYTQGGRVSSITYPSGRTVDFNRTSCMCKVDSVTTTYNSIMKTLMQNLEYRPFGGAKAMNTGGGGTVGSTFDDAGRMTISNPRATHEKTYTYDNNGNLTSITAPSLPHHSRVFGYDDLDRLEHAEGPWGIIDYTYDDVGNRLTKTVDSITETYNYEAGTNRLGTVTNGEVTNYIYDENGNITGIGNRALVYNQNNRLVRVEEDSTILGDYTYNGLGQRIIKEVGGITTIFHYDFDGNIIGESNTTGEFAQEYIYRGSSRLAMVEVASSEIYFYGNDSLGTPVILTDSTNTVVWEAAYEPFGEADVNPNSTVENNFRFKGQYYDSETGFHYNYHRYYEPTTGRYLAPDPIGQAGGINLYTYVENDPINNTDPLGLSNRKKACETIAANIAGILQHGDHHLDKNKSMKHLCTQLMGYLTDFNKNNCGVYHPGLLQSANMFLQQHCQNQMECEAETSPISPTTEPNNKPMEIMGLTGAALVIYFIISEVSRVLFPPRNLIPVL